MVGRVMSKDISVAQGGLPVVEATRKINLFEFDLFVKPRLHLRQKPVIQSTIARHVIAEEMVSEVYKSLQITGGLFKVFAYLPAKDWVATIDANPAFCPQAFDKLGYLGPYRSGHKVRGQ